MCLYASSDFFTIIATNMLITINVPITIKLTKKIPFNGLTSVTDAIISTHPSKVRILNNVIRELG
jgi:hypothetical protein